jgi:dynein intermediate chain
MKENRPLYSFEDNGDYVYDVAWSPVHPALFATVDGTGRLDLWDLNQVTVYVAAAAAPAQAAGLLCVIALRFIVLLD